MPARIVVEGVYGHIRHPIYTANLAMLTGLALATGSGWLLRNAFLLGVFCVVSAMREENWTSRTFSTRALSPDISRDPTRAGILRGVWPHRAANPGSRPETSLMMESDERSCVVVGPLPLARYGR